MPIYEFQCLTCGNEFERLQSFSESQTPSCPNCQSANVQRKLSPPAIHFKGSGWYITDSKNGAKNGKSNKEPAAKNEASKGAPVEADKNKTAAADAGGESKVAAKSESKSADTKTG